MDTTSLRTSSVPSSISSFTSTSPSVIASKAPMFDKVMDPIVDALVEAFADALVKGLEGLLNKVIDDIGRHLQAGQGDDGFELGPLVGGPLSAPINPGPFGGGGDFGGAGAGGGWEAAPTTRSAPSTLAVGPGNGPQRTNDVLDSLNVERNPRYLPSGPKGNRTTWCNRFAQDALRQLGVPQQHAPSGLANQMNDFLNKKGAVNGWRRVSAQEAQQMANLGKPTLATWKNPTGGHGHIGVIRPGELKGGSPTMAQAGGRNFNNGTVRQGFGSKEPQYFVYEGMRNDATTKNPTTAGASAGAGLTGTTQTRGSNTLSGFKSNQYDSLIREMSAKYGVPARLIKSVIDQESKFNPNAGSGKGARGLMQLMPATARELGVRNSLDPRQNIEGGTKYLARMLKMFKGDVPRALAAYNAGPGNVIKYRGIPPFRETRTYVRNIMANYNKA